MGKPHSPGPWRWDIGVLSDALGSWVLRLDDDDMVDVADADQRLIAAAPEMLALLRKAEWMDMRPISAMPRCASCFSNKALGHAEGCKLAALLARIEG